MRFWGRFFCRIIAFVFPIFLYSCSNRSETDKKIIDLRDSFYWLECSKNDSIYSAAMHYDDFKKFDTSGTQNIKKLVGDGEHYVWLRAEFTVPSYLRFRSLAMVISSLTFADKLWLNKTFIDSYGEFPPNGRSALFESHYYSFPENALNSSGKNVIYIKVCTLGKSSISDLIYIGEPKKIKLISYDMNFIHSKIYLIFEGGLFAAFILYFLMHLWHKDEKANISFALLNLFTVPFLFIFIGPETPWFFKIPYDWFVKVFLCGSFYIIIFFVTSFVKHFLSEKEPPKMIFLRCVMLFVCTCITYAAKDYTALMKLTPLMLVLSAVHLSSAIVSLVKILIFGDKNTRSRKQAFILLAGFTPFFISVILDCIVRLFWENTNYPYFAILGWQFSIVGFLIVLAVRYNKARMRAEFLNNELESEVARKTRDLSESNEKLEAEMYRANVDLEMASIVQQKFFPTPKKSFRGWDLAVCYSPVAKVSGDLYDVYSDAEKLNGVCLFDVSGHGIAASLITMLSKTVIFHEFHKAIKKNYLMSDALYKINSEIIAAKGDVENYLTGILMKVSPFDSCDACKLELSNAGHPNPILYSAASGCCTEIIHDENQAQYGAIGLQAIDVSFPQISFEMQKDDVLLFFTDGLLESMNKNREEFGKERVMEILSRTHASDAQAILESLKTGLRDFMGENPRDDDLTIIVMKRTNSFDYIEELELEGE